MSELTTPTTAVPDNTGRATVAGLRMRTRGSYSSLCKSIEIAMIISWEDFT